MKRIYIILSLLSIYILALCNCKHSDADDVVEIRKPKSGSVAEIIKNPVSASAPIDTSNMAKLKFTDQFYEYGTVTEGTKVKHSFQFKNTGNVALVINDARSSCGCTVPTYPKFPIPPGHSDSIVVVFNTTDKINGQRKIVTITSNTFPAETKIYLTGIVKSKTKK
ncbi:MAG TPA: DUF1573 domain-containing protein [Saprospiraceae bacterium]|nr:DUF1573 domain-containing protein [Saprospiraceae bacterium]